MTSDGQTRAYDKTTPRGNNFRAVRQSLNMTIKEAAEAIGVAAITVWSWEKGRNEPHRCQWDDLTHTYKASKLKPVFKYAKGMEPTGKSKKVTREIVHDCVEQRVRLVKEWY